MRSLASSVACRWSLIPTLGVGLALVMGASGCGGSGDESSIFSVGESSDGVEADNGGDESSADTDSGETGPKLDMDDGGQMTADDGMGTEPQCAKVDVLYVIDNSPSMYEEQLTLIQNFEVFVNDMQAALVDVESYHVGAVTSDNYFDEGSPDSSR